MGKGHVCSLDIAVDTNPNPNKHLLKVKKVMCEMRKVTLLQRNQTNVRIRRSDIKKGKEKNPHVTQDA